MSKKATKTEPEQEQKTIQCYIVTKDGQRFYYDISIEQARKLRWLQKLIREERAEKLKGQKKTEQK